MRRQQKLLLSFMAWGLALLHGITVATALTPQEIAQTALGSTVLLVIKRSWGRSSLGSGFVVHDGQIATNYHVIKGIRSGYAKLVGGTTEYAIETILAVDKERDLAIVAVTRQIDLAYQPVDDYSDRSKTAYWNGRNDNGELVASGVYFYQFRAGDYSQMRRLVIVR